jgi:hypothetical protein
MVTTSILSTGELQTASHMANAKTLSPGFNDTFRSETEVLQDISEWLKATYEQNNKLSGIIYLHSINQPRMEGSALRNLKMFRELCGPDPLKNVVLATTFWDKVDEREGTEREEELAGDSNFWGGMLNRGSRMERIDSRDAGLRILSTLIRRTPKTLQIQRELVEDSKPLIDTGAGQMVNEELARLDRQHKKEKEEMQAQIEDALRRKDEEMQDILQEQSQKLEDEISRVHRQQQQLKEDRRAETRRLENQFQNAMFDLKSRNEELLQNVENLQGDARRRQREKIQQEERLYELEKYNEQARKKWEGLDIDAVIAKVRAEEGKLRVDEREKLEAEIRNLQKNEASLRKGRKRDTAVNVFFGVLRTALPIATMCTLGIPISLPSFLDPSGGGQC